MYIVETEVKPSTIHGLGVFALRDVKKHEIIWSFDSIIDRLIPESIIDYKDSPYKAILHFCYYVGSVGSYVLSCDNSRYENHHDTLYNTISIDHWTSIARRDISAGEELLCNYFQFDEKFKGF